MKEAQTQSIAANQQKSQHLSKTAFKNSPRSNDIDKGNMITRGK